METIFEFKEITFNTGAGGRRITASGTVTGGGALNVSGPSGSGKTTLLRILARLREADSGEVLFKGKSWSEYQPVEWRRRIHYLSQKPAIFDGTVEQNLQRPFELVQVKREVRFEGEKAISLLENLEMSPKLMKQDARTLSGGEASRLALIRALLAEPAVLLLDEPLAALDQKTSNTVLDLLSRWVSDSIQRALVVVSHAGELGLLPNLSVVEIGKEAGGAV